MAKDLQKKWEEFKLSAEPRLEAIKAREKET